MRFDIKQPGPPNEPTVQLWLEVSGGDAVLYASGGGETVELLWVRSDGTIHLMTAFPKVLQYLGFQVERGHVRSNVNDLTKKGEVR